MAQKTQQISTITCDRCNAETRYEAENSNEVARWSHLSGQRKQGAAFAIEGMSYGADLCPTCTAQFEAWFMLPNPERLRG